MGITIRAAITYKCIGGLIAALILWGCARPPQNGQKASDKTQPRQSESAARETKIRVVTTKVSLKWQEGDKVRLAATAAKGVADELTGTGVLEDVRATLYSGGKPAAQIRAPRVRADRKTATVVASGGVVLRSIERNTIVRSQIVEWQADRHKIIAKGGVRVDSENGRIVADSAVADTELKTIEFRAGPQDGLATIGAAR